MSPQATDDVSSATTMASPTSIEAILSEAVPYPSDPPPKPKGALPPQINTLAKADCHPEHSPIFRIDTPSLASMKGSHFSDSIDSNDFYDTESTTSPTVLFPSMRLLLAVLLCCCYITLSISSSNIAVALICMIKCPLHGYGGDLEWQSDQEGLVLAAQNAGSLLMVVTGLYADRINGKVMVAISLVMCTAGNFMLPLMAEKSFWFAVGGRILIGIADACMSPAVNSLITRWFPQSERAAAVGIITGGRQIGTLFILPTAGYLCTRKDINGGWPTIFLLSGMISGLVVFFWLPMGADKPSKQYCISQRERLFIESRIACESIGKRSEKRDVPWRNILTSTPMWVGIFSLICHEYPLVILLQFLPNYMRDVLEFAPTKNGLFSALPISFLFISKMLSSSLSSWLTKNTEYDSTLICKTFNGVASLGLSLSILIVPFCDKDHTAIAIGSLCLAMAFAGLHTPGVQTALLQLAPPFSGIITGISFFIVAWFSICNKILTKWIVQHGTREEWGIVFFVSSAVAFLPVIVFSMWGDNERQWWAAPSSRTSVHSFSRQQSRRSTCSTGSAWTANSTRTLYRADGHDH
uniref:MFS domain-containing protein n=1 Tax=Panagrellus redivivus TaxID=6233 RepID=A0A7E4W215_PANRE